MSPYIEQLRRTRLEEDMHLPVPRTTGELNWMLTQVALRYLCTKPVGYAAMNDVMGAFASAAQEFYRKVAVPYENEKCLINGEVY